MTSQKNRNFTGWIVVIAAVAVLAFLGGVLNVGTPTPRGHLASVDGGSPRPTNSFEKPHCPAPVGDVQVLYTDGFTGDTSNYAGHCTSVNIFPLNTPAYSVAVAHTKQCEPGHGIVMGGSDNNAGTCR